MAANMIGDGDFESGVGQWQFSNGGSGVGNESETVTNNYCHITSTSAAYQTIAFTAGKSYTLTLNTRGNTSGVAAVVVAGTNTTYWSQPFNAALNTEWTQEVYTFTSDSSWTGELTIHFSAAYNADSTAAVDIDNLVLVQV
ncbi:hypothetical protein ACIPMZ_16490 [Scandinavium goeteborgense]|uniref:hypothetical protein n=1 Tax=Scandinavium goeteborgense TaxID=1851514 RepID=UPI003811DD4A